MPNNYIDDVKVDGVVNDIHDKRLETVATVATTGSYNDLLDKPEIGGDLLVNITYSDLCDLVDGSELVPGTKYRITDYVTKIRGYYDLSSLGAQGYLHYAKSAEHPFDLVVTALSESELSEHAEAMLHSGDTYFANSNLGAWDIKYTIENDPYTYSWADPDNGKGVIYFMRDEFDNEAGYDFKNAQFLAYALSAMDGSTHTSLAWEDESSNRYGSTYHIYQTLMAYMQSGSYNPPIDPYYDFYVSGNILGVIQFPEINDTYLSTFNAGLYYTFDLLDEDGNHLDLSLHSAESGKQVCYLNKIAQTYDALTGILYWDTENPFIKYGLACNIFENNMENAQCYCNSLGYGCFFEVFGYGAFNNTLASLSYGNTFGDNCHSNTFGYNCSSNTFGDDCLSNTFGYNCSSNTFGYNCYSNTFGYNCSINTFGYYCYSNTFGDNCHSNTFGDYCSRNTFGDDCHSNTFGDYYYSNTFGDVCYSNTFGYNCYSNTFGYNCYSNTFGYYCYRNTFGDDCHSNTFGDDCLSNTFGDGCCYIDLGASKKNITLHNGVTGTLSQRLQITETGSSSYSTDIYAHNSKEVIL